MSEIKQAIKEELKALHKANKLDLPSIRKGISTNSGLVNFDLDKPAKLAVPVFDYLRKNLPREKGDGGIQANWRTVVGVNTSGVTIGIQENHRNVDSQITYATWSSPYALFGQEQYVSYSEQEAAEDFDDILATAETANLINFINSEEQELLGGLASSSMGLGTAPNVTLTLASGNTGFASGTVVRVNTVALSNDGLWYLNGNGLNSFAGQVTITTMDGDSETRNQGLSAAGTSQTITLTASGQSVLATWPVVSGASAYAVFAGQAGSDATTYANQISYLNSAPITAVVSGNQALGSNFATDYSYNPLVLNGFLTIAQNGYNQFGLTQSNLTAASNLGPIFVSAATSNTGFSSNGFGGATEIDNILKLMFQTGRRLLSPDVMLMSPKTKIALQKVMNPSGQYPLFKIDVAGVGENKGQTTMSTNAPSYTNSIACAGTAPFIDILIHPFMPDGAILFLCTKLPYTMSNVSNPFAVRCRRDVWEKQWPERTTRYEYGIYSSETLICYYLGAIAYLNNVNVG